MIIFFAAIAFALSAWLSFRACEPISALYIADIPNERSLHIAPKPRSGGIAIVAGFFLTLAGIVSLWATAEQARILAPIAQGALLISLVSFFDDLYNIPSAIRLPLHFAAAFWVVQQGWLPERLELPYFVWEWSAPIATVITLFFIAWMVNLYNFMDGMDGFSGGMGVIGFGTFALMGWLQEEPLFTAVAVVASFATFGFLLFNFPPSHLFMGDTGACLLGFLAASMTLWSVQDEICPLWSALVLFLPFTLDSTITLLGRISRLERVWEGERNHFYHWLLLRIGHRRALLAHYPMMFGCSGAALLGVYASEAFLALMTFGVAFLFLFFYGRIIRIARETPVLEELR